MTNSGVFVEKKTPSGLGPAILVTAAFIGPGTVMTASSAGAKFGYLLLWTVGFSVFATIVLQEMAARLGIATGNGLSQALKSSISNPLVRFLALALVILAIFVGNAAYQTSNIIGAAAGVMTITSDSSKEGGSESPATITNEPSGESNEWIQQEWIVYLIGLFAIIIIWIGRFDVLQWVLTGLVAMMSILFIVAAIRSGPDWSEVIGGFKPSVPKGSDWIVIGLIGTTVVPYNLFLHASAAAQRWKNEPNDLPSPGSSNESASNTAPNLTSAIRSSRIDTTVSVLIGGLVTCAILITASAAFHSADQAKTLKSVGDVALQLEPALGSWAKTTFALGLLAAGLTSAITAPIAAGYAAAGCFGWPGKLSDLRLKIAATLVVLFGVVFAVQFGNSPKETIILAQVANGLLLPIIAIGLLIMANNTNLMKEFKNRTIGNILAGAVILIIVLIAINQFRKVGGSLQKLFAPQIESARIGDAEVNTKLSSPKIDCKI